MYPINHHNLGLLFTGLNTAFRRGQELAKPIYTQVAMTVPSGTSKEQYDWLGGDEGMREWIGDRVLKELGTHQYEITNKLWESSLRIKRTVLEDDREGIYAPMAERMGEAARLHPDELVFEAIDNGRTGLGYDGVAFFSASHPADIQPAPPSHPGTQSNLHSDGAGPYWYLADLSSTFRPMIFQRRTPLEFTALTGLRDHYVFHNDEFRMGVRARYNVGYGLWQQMFASNRTLNETNVEAAIEAMTSLVNDAGKPLNVFPTHIIVPTTLQFDAKRIFAPDIVPNSAGTAEISNIHRGAAQIIVSKHLARS